MESSGIKIDENSLTGESQLVSKDSYENCLKKIDNNKNNISPIILSG